MSVRCWVFCLTFTGFCFSGPNEMKGELMGLVRGLSKQYHDKNPDLLFQKNLAVLNLKNTSTALKSVSAGESISALISAILGSSTQFRLLEREELQKITREIALSESGLTEGKPLRAGKLQAADLLLEGTVSELGSKISVMVRLVEVEKGEIVATAATDLPRELVLQEAKLFLDSAFQGKSGILFAVFQGLVFVPNLTGRNSLLMGIDVGYRINRSFRFGLGFDYLNNENFLEETFPASSIFNSTNKGWGNISVNRTVGIESSLLKLFVDCSIPLSHRLVVGLRGEGGFNLSKIHQKFIHLPAIGVFQSGTNNAFYIDAADRTLDVIAHDPNPPLWGHLFCYSEFLLVPRLSLALRAGYLYFPDYFPKEFDAQGEIHKSGSIDSVGTYPSFFNYNFARTQGGELLKASLSGFSLSLALSLHI